MRIAATPIGDWIDFREDLSRDELNALMGQSRYGIQAMENEHFGMATAEMTRAGCLVFAHASGGSLEVLNNERRAAVATEGDAVARDRGMRATADCNALRARLEPHAQTFSTERFVDQFRDIVDAGTSPTATSRQLTEARIGSAVPDSVPSPATLPSRR